MLFFFFFFSFSCFFCFALLSVLRGPPSSRSLRGLCVSAVNDSLPPAVAVRLGQVGLDALARVGELLGGGHLLEVGGAVGLLGEPVG